MMKMIRISRGLRSEYCPKALMSKVRMVYMEADMKTGATTENHSAESLKHAKFGRTRHIPIMKY